MADYCDKHGDFRSWSALEGYGIDQHCTDVGDCPWCRVAELEDECDHWRAEAMAAREFIESQWDTVRRLARVRDNHGSLSRWFAARKANEVSDAK